MKKILCLVLIIFIYRAVFINPELIGGDWPYYFTEYLSTLKLPEIWNPLWPTGLGGNQAIILPLKLYLQIVVWIFVDTLGVLWTMVQKVFFFWLFLILCVYSSYKLTKSWIGVLIYTSNTWILMVFSGGQVGVMLAYAIAPLILGNLIESIRHEVLSVKYIALTALVFAIEVMFDIRVAFLTMLVVLGYIIFHHFFISRINIKPLIPYTLYFILYTILLHAFWILPSVLIALKGGNVASVIDTASASLEFLSFANFENSLSLLHPNWPENIFGKVGFMRPEFLMIPIIAYSSLLFLNLRLKTENLRNRTILFFAILGLIGAFLAKGVQEPFGVVFNFLYSNVPGFNLFRDPVKFYILIAFSYSLIVPYSLKQIGKFQPAGRRLKKIIPIAFIVFWAYLNLPFILNSNVGIFKQRSVPSEYVRLKEFLVQDTNFSRTLWIPSVQRFAFMSNNHPTISYQDLFKSNFASEFKSSEFQTLLSELSIKYVIVPYDSEGEIFLNDRKYEERLYQKTIAELNKVSLIKRVEEPGKIAVYEIAGAKPHIFLTHESNNVAYERKSATEYYAQVNAKIPSRLVFSEQFDKGWIAEDRSIKYKVSSIKYKNLLNSFELPKAGSYNLRIYYEPQKWTTIGYLISGLTMISALVVIGISLRKK